jgi:hypothetical protein
MPLLGGLACVPREGNLNTELKEGEERMIRRFFDRIAAEFSDVAHLHGVRRLGYSHTELTGG